MIQRDFLNFLRTPEGMTFEGAYDIPVVKGITLKHPEKFNPKLVEFHLANKIPQNQRQDRFVQFFLDDYLFERTWSRPEENSKFLSSFKGVLSPDFSQYTNMPEALCIYNHYRKMWVSAFWQLQGLRVIPVAGWGDEASFAYCFDGMPKKSLIAVSSVGCQRFSKEFQAGYEAMLEHLEPSNVLWYGKPFDWLDTENVICVEPEYENRFKTLREKQGELNDNSDQSSKPTI